MASRVSVFHAPTRQGACSWSPSVPAVVFGRGCSNALSIRCVHSGAVAPAKEETTSGNGARPNVPQFSNIPLSDIQPHENTDDRPYFSSPWPQDHRGATDTRPLMFYLPGIDGTGLAAVAQFAPLSEVFILSCLTIPPTNRDTFEELLERCVAHITSIAADIPPTRPIYLLGESFGGILALAVGAAAPHIVDRIVVVNPATSFPESPWASAAPLLEALPKEAYTALPYVLAPVLSNPIAMAAHKAITLQGPLAQFSALMEGLQDLTPNLGKLAQVLPQDTLLWRLKLLQQGCDHLDSRYHEVYQRVLVVASTLDLLIPSQSEAEELPKLLPHCRTALLQNRSHAALQEAGVDLIDIMREEGFLTETRRLTGDGATRSKRMRGLGIIGRPLPIELPTEKERLIDAAQIDSLKAAVSPVFFSTSPSGDVMQGLAGLNLKPGRPVLLVGNHQTIPVDIAPLVEGIYAETRVLARGLTHPVAAGQAGTPKPRKREPQSLPAQLAATAGTRLGGRKNEFISPQNNEDSGTTTTELGNGVSGSFLKRWGAVVVGAKALVSLLRAGETVLLFPGGGTEALKGSQTVDRYKLIWSERPEFVRAAAKYSATIVPFGAIGCEEASTSIMNSDNFNRLGEGLARLQGRPEPPSRPRVSARKGVNADEMFENDLAMRFYVPAKIERYYFLFGTPIETSRALCSDRDATAATYARVRRGVEDCLTFLLEARERDPFNNTPRRLAYERANGRPAPSFDPSTPDLKAEAQKLDL